MRKITSKYKESKRRRRNGLIIGFILIGIMVFSILGYSFIGKEDSTIKKLNYNGFEFVEQNGFWITNIESLQFFFRYNPEQVEEIGSELKYLENYKGKTLYIFSENSEAELEIYKNLFYQNQIILRIQPACFKGEICEGDFPTKTCKDNFIIIKESENSGITQEENCIFIKGKQEDLVKITDTFLFKILRIQ